MISIIVKLKIKCMNYTIYIILINSNTIFRLKVGLIIILVPVSAAYTLNAPLALPTNSYNNIINIDYKFINCINCNKNDYL